MDKYEIEPQHIAFAIASVITSMLFTVFFTPSSLGSLALFIIALLLMVQILSVIIGTGIYKFVKRVHQLITFKNTDVVKRPLESGDIVLNAAVITTGAIVLETYNLIKTKNPILIADGVNAFLILVGISILTFVGSYLFYKTFSLI
ncbi:MAG: hypothetical protein ACP5OA_03625 [Candidatus Woesearchaeota archaeon]